MWNDAGANVVDVLTHGHLSEDNLAQRMTDNNRSFLAAPPHGYFAICGRKQEVGDDELSAADHAKALREHRNGGEMALLRAKARQQMTPEEEAAFQLRAGSDALMQHLVYQFFFLFFKFFFFDNQIVSFNDFFLFLTIKYIFSNFFFSILRKAHVLLHTICNSDQAWFAHALSSCDTALNHLEAYALALGIEDDVDGTKKFITNALTNVVLSERTTTQLANEIVRHSHGLQFEQFEKLLCNALLAKSNELMADEASALLFVALRSRPYASAESARRELRFDKMASDVNGAIRNAVRKTLAQRASEVNVALAMARAVASFKGASVHIVKQFLLDFVSKLLSETLRKELARVELRPKALIVEQRAFTQRQIDLWTAVKNVLAEKLVHLRSAEGLGFRP